MTATMPCRACREGKHTNCMGWALDDHDREVDCPCPHIVAAP